ncbi:MAG: hypothetical protein WC942_08760 [Clostridia bacterium]|jgi:hypothetical protein
MFEFNCSDLYRTERDEYPDEQSFFNDYASVKSFYQLKEGLEKDKIFTDNEKQIILKVYDTILTEDEIKIYFDYRQIYDIKINDEEHVLLYYGEYLFVKKEERKYIDLTDLYLKDKNIFDKFEVFEETKTMLKYFLKDEY